MRVQKRMNPFLAGKKRMRGWRVSCGYKLQYNLGWLGIGWVEMTKSAATYSKWEE